MASTLAVSPSVSPASAAPGPGLVIATGKVVDALGVAVPQAEVALQMWPSNDTLAAAGEGDPVNLVTVASASTDAVGNFELKLPSIADLQSGAGGDNIVDLSLTTTTPDGTSSSFAFSRRLVNTDVLGLTIEAAVDPEMPSNLVSDLIAGLTQQVVVPLTGLVLGENALGGRLRDVLPSETVPENLLPEDEVVPIEEDAIVPKNCSTTVAKDLGQRVTEVNAAGVGWAGATTDFEYTNGATSTLGVAVSVNGTMGSWSAGGSSSLQKQVDSTSTVGFPVKSTGYWHRKTYFRYKSYKIECWYSAYGVVKRTVRYEARPSNFVGGATTVGVATPPTPPRGNCAPQEAGSRFARSSSTATTWSNGVALKNVLGVDLSSRTGYSKTAKITIEYTKAGWICGTQGDPGDTPRTLIARKNRPS
ncbi:hypothetical protein [Pimelobacter sp. 30-1]|uniref:hypothetical protein n=1 Tax=Pimelobacter sp. 30-1 TaxID=2004991 RepID=UPI001C05524E|nr:hypothetical protein [Pimelobacter sp. 30-1]